MAPTNKKTGQLYRQTDCKFTERTVSRILLAQDGLFLRYAPFDIKQIVQYRDATISLWSLEDVTFVLKHRRLAQYGKAVNESLEDEEIPVIIFRQFENLLKKDLLKYYY